MGLLKATEMLVFEALSACLYTLGRKQDNRVQVILIEVMDVKEHANELLQFRSIMAAHIERNM